MPPLMNPPPAPRPPSAPRRIADPSGVPLFARGTFTSQTLG
jgi:hypothetical protein